MKNNKTHLIEFETDIFNKRYTRCSLKKIVGSDECKACTHFKGKIADNCKTANGKFVHKGIVECDKNK